MNKPTKAEITKLVEDVQALQRRRDNLSDGTFRPEEETPEELANRVREAAEAYNLPKATAWVRNHHAHKLQEIIDELGELRAGL